MGFGYLCLLLFILIFILYLLKINIEVSPKKIMLLINISLVTLILKYLLLIAGFTTEKQSVIYFLSFLAFSNYFSIPLMVVILLFIFMRDEKFRFNTNYIFMILLFGYYLYLIIFNNIDISINSHFGFVLRFENDLVGTLSYLIIISSLTVFNLIFIDKPYGNKLGLKMLFITLVVCILEIILFLGGIKVFPYPIIGEALMLVSLFKGISTFK